MTVPSWAYLVLIAAGWGIYAATGYLLRRRDHG